MNTLGEKYYLMEVMEATAASLHRVKSLLARRLYRQDSPCQGANLLNELHVGTGA